MTVPDDAMMMDLMTRVWPLHRTLVSRDMDRTLEIIGEYVPDTVDYQVRRYPSGQKIWTWTVPERYEVDEAYLEALTPEGPVRVVDFADNPLHVVSYSPPVDVTLDFAELEPRLHYNKDVPTGIPWQFRFYDRDWGFCLSYETFQALDRSVPYRAVIRSRFEQGEMGVGELSIPGTSDEWILIVCATCHPYQVNDSISGVVVALDYARRIAGREPGYYGVKILFLPETVGSVGYLANNEGFIDKCRYGFFSEMIGHDNTLRLQRSRQDNHILDRVARYVLERTTGGDFIEGPFCHTIITNDEKVTNAPGVDIPTIALNRWPYDLYHTSEDTPAVMIPEKLAEVSRVYEDIVDILQRNYYVRRRFRGPLFLSGLDWDFDWKATRKLKRAVQDVMFHLEGDETVFDIAQAVDLDFDTVRRITESMRRMDLIEVAWEPLA